MKEVEAYGTLGPSQDLEQMTIKRRTLSSTDVQIKLTTAEFVIQTFILRETS